MQVGGHNNGPMSEINVTPLVDVMLVLLIIFMVAAPMMVSGIEVNLPQASAKALDSDNQRLVVTLTAEEKIFLDEVEVDEENLAHKIKAVLEQKADQQVYLRADGEVPWGFVAKITASLKEAGVERVGMVTEPVGSAGTKAKKDEEVAKTEGS